MAKQTTKPRKKKTTKSVADEIQKLIRQREDREAREERISDLSSALRGHIHCQTLDLWKHQSHEAIWQEVGEALLRLLWEFTIEYPRHRKEDRHHGQKENQTHQEESKA